MPLFVWFLYVACVRDVCCAREARVTELWAQYALLLCVTLRNRVQECPIIVLVNKSDQPGAMTADEATATLRIPTCVA